MKKTFTLRSWNLWLAPVLGGIGGIIYATVDEELIKKLFGVATPASIVFAHDIVDFVLPVIFGVMIGLAINTIRKQARLNRKLSIQNEKLERDLLVNTLTSLFLHEIRNPVHNIAAALDDESIKLPPETDDILKRNLKRLEETTIHYRKWGSLFNKIDPYETTDFRTWLKEFLENKVLLRFKELDIKYSLEIDPVKVKMHPVLLDQCFTVLISNACEALSLEFHNRELKLVASLMAPSYKNVEIKLINRGAGFPSEALEKQGHATIESKTGMGIGLTLLRKILEIVNGEMILSNFIDHAEVSLIIPGDTE